MQVRPKSSPASAGARLGTLLNFLITLGLFTVAFVGDKLLIFYPQWIPIAGYVASMLLAVISLVAFIGMYLPVGPRVVLLIIFAVMMTLEGFGIIVLIFGSPTGPLLYLNIFDFCGKMISIDVNVCSDYVKAFIYIILGLAFVAVSVIVVEVVIAVRHLMKYRKQVKDETDLTSPMLFQDNNEEEGEENT